ncbi:MAG: molybdopterin-dependent oxidoreductase [Candidatus Cloacimonetes bacterium]|nr:molybdopterin-dependent oxidoreductase [Candidatus Cloacimonadota bacterium]
MNQIIGKKVIRIDGYEKVTGKAIFGDDIRFSDMLYAACKYTDIPAGKITKINISKAEKMAGVEAIALYKNIPGQKRVGPICADHYAIVKDEVFYSGDVIAVVAAKSKEIAYKAVDAIEVDYEPIKGVFDIEEAVKPASRLIHPEFKSNIVIHYPLRKGSVEKGFAESDFIIERKYKTSFYEHAYIEPETVTAVPDPTTKGFKIYGSIQNPYTTRKIVAQFMGLRMNQVNVMSSTLGGSFGGKDDVINLMACRVALLSKMTGKPIKLTNVRENSIKESYKRHPYIMNYKVGFNRNGKLNAMKINILADSGAYSSQSFFVTWRSVVQATGPYEIENVETDIRAVYTNNTYTAAFRGFGSPQVIFAQESLMDEIAATCGISPLEIRKINGYKQGSITASGQKLSGHKVSLLQVIDEAAKKSNYKEKIIEYRNQNKIDNRYKYGIGLSCSFRGCSLGAEGTDASSAIVSVQADGSVYILAGCNENGQGLKTTFSQIAAEVLGINFNKIVFLEPQTATITDGGPTVASRSTLMGGNAIVEAAQKVKNTIFNVIKDELKVSKIEDTEWKNNYIFNKKSKIKIRFEDASEKAYWAGENLSAYGWAKAPDVSWEEKTGQGNAYFTYVYGCQIAEIKVDTHTGKIDVLKITAAHDVGKVINKLGAEGQVYGGVAQGIGYGIFEDYNIQNGIVKSENLDEYLIPTIKDIHKIDPILIENPDKFGPFGAKSIGEPTLELTAAAINNALSFATGKRSYQIPLTLEQVFLGKNLRKPGRQSEIIFLKSKKNKVTPRITNIKIETPTSLNDALELLSKDKYKIISGGTDMIIQLRKNTKFRKLLNIYNLSELKNISEDDDKIRIGSAVTFTDIIENESIRKNFPLLIKACSLIGSKQIRNRGTIGGNIINASPSTDSVPPLIVYKARLLLQSKNSNREINVEDFIIKNYQTQIKPEEILTAIIIPKLPDKKYYHSYFKLGRRNAMNIARLSLCVMISFDKKENIKECFLVAGSLLNRPQRLTKIEEILIGRKLTSSVINEIENPLKKIIDSKIGTRWSAEYKMPVFINLCKDALDEIKIQRLATDSPR